MLIVCPSCSSAYRIELSALGPTGRPVRCGKLRYFAVALAISIHLSKFSSPMFFLIFS